MPIIGQAKIQDAGNTSRGVLVDKGGYFLARVQWTGKRPVVNGKDVPDRERKRLVTLDSNPNAANIPGDSARWDFEALDWVAPTDEFALVTADTGQLVKRFKGFKERLPDIPEGTVIVDDAPPKAKSYKPIYDMAAQAFVKPRRVALVDPDGVVQNIALENPNDTAPDVALPEDWTRFDDSAEWPTDTDGDPVGIGAENKGGRWSKKKATADDV